MMNPKTIVREVPKIDEAIEKIYIEMHEELGNMVSRQYGGSDTHKQAKTKFELFTSMERHLSNTFSDPYKQV